MSSGERRENGVPCPRNSRSISEGSSLVRRFHPVLAVVALVSIVATSCAAGSPTGSQESARREPNAALFASTPVDPFSVYDPVRGGEPVPRGYRPLLARDDILPIYQPVFVEAGVVDWAPDSLVIGVDLEGEARAYPVAFLTRREMVIDNHRGIPTLVTW